MDQQAKAGVAVAVQIQMPPGKAQRHLAAGVLALLAVGVLRAHLVEGDGHDLPVRHVEVQPAVQAAQPFLPIALAADHQHPHQDQKCHTVQSLTLHQAPDTRQNTRDKDHAVDDILSQPDLFQFSHVYSPFLSPIFLF